MNQRKILLFEALEVAQHFVFAVVRVEHRVSHEIRLGDSMEKLVFTLGAISATVGAAELPAKTLKRLSTSAISVVSSNASGDVVGVHLADVDASLGARRRRQHPRRSGISP